MEDVKGLTFVKLEILKIMNANKLVSIIIPVYNSEKYLGMMVDSVLQQTYTDFELILVDDGSTDNSVTMVDNYARQDSRVKVIHKSNGGVSSARNVGLEVAMGEYVVFWDNDDYVYPDYLDVMIREIGDYDLLITRPVQCHVKDSFAPLVRERTNRCIAEAHFDNLSSVFPVIDTSEIAWVWAQMYKRGLLKDNNIRFENINSEDTMFSYSYIKHIRSIKMIDYAGYCYIHRAGSLSNSHRYVAEMDWIEKRYDLYKDIWKNLQIDIDKNDIYKHAVFYRFAIRISAFLYKGYHRDTRVPRKERLKRWGQVAKSEVFSKIKSVKINRKSHYFLSLTKKYLYYVADPFLLILTDLKERS